MGSSPSFDRDIERQEKYVNSQFSSVRKQIKNHYSDKQIRGKLRQEFFHTGNKNDYVLESDWRKIKK